MIPQSSVSSGSLEPTRTDLPTLGPRLTGSSARDPTGRAPQPGRSSHKLKIPHFALQYLLALGDGFLIIFASIVGGGLYQIVANGEFRNADQLLGAGIIAALIYVLIGQSCGFYDLHVAFSRHRRDAGRIVMQWSLVSLLLTLLVFLMKSGAVFSRGSIICFGSLALLLLLVCRQFAKRLVVNAVADGQVQGRRAIVLGTREELAALGVDELLERFGLTEVDRVIFSSDRDSGFAMSEDESSSLEQALAVGRERSVDEIVLAFPWSDTRKLELVRDRLRISPLPVQLVPDRRIRSLAENPSFRLRRSLSIEIQRGPLSRAEQLSKRLVDIAGASLGLILLMPLMLLSAIAIKIDSPGPVFFRQRRNGFNAKQFSIFKFRTMTVMEDGIAVVQAKRFDPRVTRVGWGLRRSSIDEVPQLINVLRGEMSLVGPRPHALAHDNHYGDILSEYAYRHHVKPGITGWAQVKGYRGETARVEQMKGRVDCDLWYINNWSLALDLKILVLTCLELTRRRNAY
ncbi:undecaprenyl-phosphate glucose phosphotransferase [Bradyrhizobium sp. SSUT112]|uniref:undecaprenyl-phosphate glucose phosphotransferase n=1 Tax=Bradyrhizobium sp. SSUT112 TaxID=3040604 RepID=UPI00244D2788|nr:undecaprenyl-phosphate glucose phosphotransferase [Bradyrhizobium sp. SSUT112]MDH2356831.1 undecaprenyl-phosphate glucose phosphotransferase [Bradyrhizobium sp. SSUT112]